MRIKILKSIRNERAIDLLSALTNAFMLSSDATWEDCDGHIILTITGPHEERARQVFGRRVHQWCEILPE